ncbi:MAG: PLP-dependent transferase [Holophaga sp.]|nr:PLP-dependent transferase [Holophaga sp.]
MDTQHLGFDSKLVHAGIPDDPMGSAVTPIYQTSTFAFRDAQQGADRFAGKAEGYIYTRIGNPTINALEVAMAQLENGVGGVATSSGMSAVSTVYLALLSAGDHVVSQASVYGPSRILMEKHMSRFGVESTFLDTTDLAAVKAAIKPNTKIIYVESPGNPGMQVTDLVAVAELAHAHGALVVVDNTFASPYLQRPLDLGCDVVLHSITKFINGHADVVGGVLVAKDEAIYKQLRAMMVMSGCNMDPHQAWLVSRGLKTLSIRVDRAQQSAQEIAKWLEKHPKIEWVSYLGLPSHPQYELVKKQMKGPGAMLSFEVKGGVEGGRRLMDAVKLATLAVSLGGVETLISHPASMTHASMGKEARLASGISDGLVRYSVGIETLEDLIADLDQALAKV